MSSQVEPNNLPLVGLRTGSKALVATSGRVLVVKERHDDGRPFWTLPGGGHEPGESPTETLHRELAEELDCRVAVRGRETSFLYVHDSSTRGVSRYTVFECDLLSSVSPNTSEGILDSRWVRPGDLPPTTIPQVRQVVETRAIQ